MSMPPDIWSSYPLYIRNEYTEEIEETNVEINRHNIEDAPVHRERVEHQAYVMPDQKFKRAQTAPFTRNRNETIEGSPIRESDHV
jgi:hypothetical protein